MKKVCSRIALPLLTRCILDAQLHLNGNGIDDAGAVALARALASNHTATEVCVQQRVPAEKLPCGIRAHHLTLSLRLRAHDFHC